MCIARFDHATSIPSLLQMAARHRASTRSRAVRLAGRILLLLLSVSCAVSAYAARYSYDANGRLIAVSNDAGGSARYHYDALGNILHVERIQADTPAIFDFSPRHGGSNDRVVVRGKGFSADPGGNIVQFNGVRGDVVAASTGELKVAVPQHAQTGPLTVMVGAHTAQGAGTFTVDPQPRAPAISDVSPRVVKAGASLSVLGVSLLPVAGQSSVRLGSRPLLLQQSSSSLMQAEVPAGVGSGRVHVTTPYGVALGADDIAVLPPGVAEAGVSQVVRMEVDGAVQDLSTTLEGKSTAIIFDTQGQDYISAQFSALRGGSLNYVLYGTDNKRLAFGTASADSPSFHLPPLRALGTYLLLITPRKGPLNGSLELERSMELQVEGAAQEATSAIAAQSRRLVFNARSGESLGLGLVQAGTAPERGSASVEVLGPGGDQVGLLQCMQEHDGCSLNVVARDTGPHTVLLTPAAAGSRRFALRASLSPVLRAPLQRDTPFALALRRPGQSARLEFAGAAGEVLGLQVSGQKTVPQGRTVHYRVHRPDGTVWRTVAATTGTVLTLALPESGRYAVVVDAAHGETVMAEMLLSSGDAGPRVDGGAVQYAARRPGDTVYFNMQAQPGDSLGLGLGGLQSVEGQSVTLNVHGTDGALLATTTCTAADEGCAVNLPRLAGGTYGVEIVPVTPEQTMRFTATLSRDLARSLQRGMPLALHIPRVGQNARLSFTAAATEVIALKISAQNTQPAHAGVFYRVAQPDGSVVASGYAPGNKTLLIDTPVAGAYEVFVDPEHGATMAAQVLLEAGELGEMELDGSIGEYENVAGEPISFAIDAVVGQPLGLGISHLQVNKGNRVRVQAYDPSGRSLHVDPFCNVAEGGCGVQLYNPVSGTYTVVVRPDEAAQTMKFRATLSSALRATLERDRALNLNLDRRGQDALLSFQGTAGETLALQIAGQLTLPAGKEVEYRIYAPGKRDWNTSIARLTADTGGAVNMVLPESGEYWVYANPQNGAAAAARLTLSTGRASGIVLDGATASFRADQPGQPWHYTVTAAAGQHMGFALSGLTVSDGRRVWLRAYGPDGDVVDHAYCYPARGACDVDIYNPAAGNYSVLVVPDNPGQRMQFTASLSSSVPLALVADVPAMLQLHRRGQDGMFSFHGVQGQMLALQIAGQTAEPAAANVRYHVFKPSERTRHRAIARFDTQTGGAHNLVLPETGTYWIWADPDEGASVRAQVTLSSGSRSGLLNDGPPVAIETTLPGQTLHFRVDARAGQHLGFGVSDLVLSSGSAVWVRAYRPDGSSLVDTTLCSAFNDGCDIDFHLTTDGVYSILLLPTDSEQAMQFKGVLSSHATLALPRDVPVVMNLPRRGQDGLLSFEGAKGETLALLVAGLETSPANSRVRLRIYRPGDRRLPMHIGDVAGGGAINVALPETGTYWVWIDPEHGAAASAHVTLSTGTTSGLEKDGAPAHFASTHPGESAHFRFEANAGDFLGFAISELDLSSARLAHIAAYDPKGQAVARAPTSCGETDGGCDVNIPDALAGSYSIVVNAATPDESMQFKASLSTRSEAELVRDVPLNVQLDRRGRDALLSFAGTEGESLALLVAAQSTVPARGSVRYHVYAPGERDPARAFASAVIEGGGAQELVLPESGVYRVWMDPVHGASASAQVTLSTGASTPLELDGAPSHVASTQPGQPVHFRIPAKAGDQMGVAITGLTTSEGTSVEVTAYDPQGERVGPSVVCSVNDGGCDIDLYSTLAGDYSILVRPLLPRQQMQFDATLTSSARIALPHGAGASMVLGRPGQDGLLTFQGIKGRKVIVQVSEQSTQPGAARVNYSVFKPSERRRGFAIKQMNVLTEGSAALTLPETGTYWIHADPELGRTAQSNVSVIDTP